MTEGSRLDAGRQFSYGPTGVHERFDPLISCNPPRLKRVMLSCVVRAVEMLSTASSEANWDSVSRWLVL